MKVLVDTSVWSLAFRRQDGKSDVVDLIDLIRDLRVAVIGPIRQELLSGISNNKVFTDLREKMGGFTDYPIQTADYELAAEFSNKCRKNGVQGSHIDFLICAVAVQNDWKIFTKDKDFLHYKKQLPIVLYKWSEER